MAGSGHESRRQLRSAPADACSPPDTSAFRRAGYGSSADVPGTDSATTAGQNWRLPVVLTIPSPTRPVCSPWRSRGGGGSESMWSRRRDGLTPAGSCAGFSRWRRGIGSQSSRKMPPVLKPSRCGHARRPSERLLARVCPVRSVVSRYPWPRRARWPYRAAGRCGWRHRLCQARMSARWRPLSPPPPPRCARPCPGCAVTGR